MIVTASDILRDLISTGHTIRLDGDIVRVRPALPPEKVELLRQHKPEIINLLRADSKTGYAVTVTLPPKTSQNASNVTTQPPKTFTRLELATAALKHLIPDEQAQRKIRALAEADAKGWRFLGTDGYQHVLSGNIMDQVERITGRLICFQCNADN
ncbi:MAG: hypothetical protein ACP5O1_12375, partial [Phycisphaerae bacterium]